MEDCDWQGVPRVKDYWWCAGSGERCGTRRTDGEHHGSTIGSELLHLLKYGCAPLLFMVMPGLFGEHTRGRREEAMCSPCMFTGVAARLPCT